ncbi:MAG: acetyltransferase [Bacteroidetes bacterium]|nr:acetyltransferase [Bacteroidota bacterium]
MKPIYILGSSGFAKEVYFLIKDIGGYSVKGFVDIESKPDLIFSEGRFEVIKESDFLGKENPQTCSLAIGIGDPTVVMKLAEKFNQFDFPNLIHPTVVYDKDNIELGMGNIITAGVIMTLDIIIGNMNIFNLSTTVGHDTLIGNYNVINPSVNISGGVTIGNTNLIGVGAVILQFKNIGNNNVIGASSLITKDVGNSRKIIGVPGRDI